MMTTRTSVCSLAAVVVLTMAAAAGRAPAGGSGAFVGARLIDPATGRVTDDSVLIVRDGRIAAVSTRGAIQLAAGVPARDLAGKFVVPGLISAHVHVSDVHGDRPRAHSDTNTQRQLEVYARYGITTVLSLDGEGDPGFAARDAQNTPALRRARMYLSGNAIAAKTPEQARQMVAATASRKPDIIKIRVDDNLGTGTKMAPEVYRAVIEEAHRLGLRVAAHIFYLDDAKELLRAGVDVIAHSVRDRDIDDEFVALMKARNVPYCPTLTRELSTFVYESTPPFFADPFFLREADRDVMTRLQEPKRQEAMRSSKMAQRYKAALVVARRNLKRAVDAGLLVAMGTDAGPQPERFQGYFEHLEMEMMVESGLTPAQVLRASTIDAARALKVEGVGALVKGAWADFVAFDRNPLEDIRTTRTIAGVWIAGNEVKR